MKRTLPGSVVGLVCLLALGWALAAAEPNAAPLPLAKAPALPDLSEFKTPETAVVTRISRAVAASTSRPGYLGVRVEPDGRGKLAVADVEPDSPAAKAGLQRGDVVVQVGAQDVSTVDVFRELILARSAGDAVKLALVR